MILSSILKLKNGKTSIEKYRSFYRPVTDFVRRRYIYDVDQLKNEFVGRFPTATLPRAWNSLSEDLKLIDSHSSFKKSLYNSLIDKYPTSIKCFDFSCPDCHYVK